MQFSSPLQDCREWSRRFAYLPTQVGDKLVWWEYYEWRAAGWNPITGYYGVQARLPEPRAEVNL